MIVNNSAICKNFKNLFSTSTTYQKGATLKSLQHPSIKILDATKVKAYETCPRRFLFEHILGWNFPSSHHLIFGRAIHDVLEFIHRRKASYDIPYNYNYPEVEKHFLKSYYPKDELYKETTVKNKTYQVMDERFSPKSIKNLIYFLNTYQTTYGEFDSWTQIQLEKGGFDTTQKLATFPFSYYFNLDMAYKENNEIYALEHKTTSLNLETWGSLWHTSIQVAGYASYLYQKFPKTFSGVIIMNGIKLANPPRLKKDGTPYANAGAGIQLSRPSVYYPNDNLLRDMLYSVRNSCYTINKNYTKLLNSLSSTTLKCFYRRDTGCLSYGTPCPYLTICQSPNPLKEQMPDYFTRSVWNPELRERVTF